MATKEQTKTRTPMSEEHKKALATGREYGRTVREYLEAKEKVKPKRGRKRSIEKVREELADVETRLPSSTSVERLTLLQRAIDLEAELEKAQSESFDIAPLEEAFVKVAKPYGESKRISYAAWREYGVEPSILKKAGITRGASHGNGSNGNGNK